MAKQKPVDKERRRDPLSRTRGFDRLPHFAGQEDEFNTWVTKVTTFLSDGPGLRDILKRAARATSEIKPEHKKELQNLTPAEEIIDVGLYPAQLHNGSLLPRKGHHNTIRHAGEYRWQRL